MFNYKIQLDSLDSDTIKTISDRVVLGPQEEVMNELEQFNRTFSSNIGITKTFRWKPGFYDKLKEIYTNDVCGWNKRSNSVYTFFNKIDNSGWRNRSFRRNLQSIDSKLRNLRNMDCNFQDNSDIVSEKLKLMQECFEGISDTDDDEFTTTVFLDEHDLDIDLPMVYFYTVIKKGTMMNVFTSDNVSSRRLIQQIPYAHDVDLFYQVPLIPWLNKLAKYEDRSRINTISSAIGQNTMASGMNYSMQSRAKAGNAYGLRNVYVSRTSNRSSYSYICEGSLAQDLRSSLLQLDFVSYMHHVKKWMKEYVVNVTQPMNPITYMYHGSPKYLTDDYKKIYSHSAEHCAYPISYENQKDSLDVYCDNVECTFRTNCNFYINTLDKDLSCQMEALIVDIMEITILEGSDDAYYNAEIREIKKNIGDLHERKRMFTSHFLSMKDNPKLIALALFTKDCKNAVSSRYYTLVWAINDIIITKDDSDIHVFQEEDIDRICEQQITWIKQMLDDEGHDFESLGIDFELANSHYGWVTPIEKRIIKVQEDNQVVLDLDGKTGVGHTDSWYEDTDGVWKKLPF